MADLLPLLTSFPAEATLDSSQARIDYDRRARNFITSLNKLSKAAVVKAYKTAEDPLETLDPAINSLSYLYALLAHVGNPSEPPTSAKAIPEAFRPEEPLWNKATHFLSCFDPIQTRYAGSEWRRLVEFLEKSARLLGAPAAAVVPIRTAILRLDPSAGTFTSTHILFIRLCLQARTYAQALPVLEKVIHSFPPRPVRGVEPALPCSAHPDSSSFINSRSGLSDKITASNVHEYFLLGGMIYIGLERYREAARSLEYALSAPTNGGAVNGLMLEAYKKWVLVACLVEGGPTARLRTVSGNTQKTLSQTSKPYEALAEVFQGGDMRRLQAEIDVGSTWWKQDGNEGLVQLLVRHLPRFYVVNLQKTYAAVPISQVATLLGKSAEETIDYLEDLVTARYLDAAIESAPDPSKPTVLRFATGKGNSSTSTEEARQHEEIVLHTNRANTLIEFIKAADHRASLTKEHLDYTRQKSRKQDGGINEDAMDTTWDGMEQPDEDIMADLR